MNKTHHTAGVASLPARGNSLGPRVPTGSVWTVSNRTEIYLAAVLGYQDDRVVIRRLCHRNIVATPTLARWSDFETNFKRYVNTDDLPT